MATIYEHPSSGAPVVDVKCPKGHKGGSGHISAGLLGTQKCGHVLKSHKEAGKEETVDGKKVRPTITVTDQACEEILVPADEKADKAHKAAAKAEAEAPKTKRAKLAGKAKSKGKGKKAANAVEPHPDRA